ncbi:restriction endonuclease subunit S [Lentibacillus salinarum]|uniref:Restriction endonuclease subunit S n=1 Tax=Lentibacillus salinarum TaxID=446820 RepID=A0ABW3ZRN5_9BACI
MSKKKQKTVEELLDEALVPEEEQPYDVPANWVWVSIGTLNNIVTGSTPSKKKDENYGGNFPFIKPTELGDEKNVRDGSEFLTNEGKEVSKIIPSESTLICCIGSIGKVGFNNFECSTNQQINSLVPKKEILNPLFNYYQSITPYFQNELINRSYATTVSIINKSKMSMIPIPLPPINEQKRIANRVEELLDKVDQAKQLIEEAKETFELRRAAILDKAFRGELTAEWRRNNANLKPAMDCIEEAKAKQHVTKKQKEIMGDELPFEIPDTWIWVRATEVADVRDGTHDSPKYQSEGYPLITSKNLKNGKLDFTNVNYISEADHMNIGKRSKVDQGDILFAMIGTIGNPALIQEIHNAFSIKNVALFKPYEGIDNEYLAYYLESSGYVQPLINKAKGSTQKFVSLGKLRDSLIPIPPLDEQLEIKNSLKGLFEASNKSNALLEKLDSETIKQSILSKAFRGELGTNDPTEESAVELLKAVLQDHQQEK